MTRICRNVTVCSLILVIFASVQLLPQTSGPVQYVYDELGRLTGVIDANGNAAAYNYDAVGNILSISRYTATQVSVISFSPSQGSQGTPVTIYGTGFSATAGQNAVSFNGVPAAVSSATSNQLNTTVPSGATSGPISVTSPLGTATSATNFTVAASGGIPAITGFAPPIASAGASVSINGVNFDPAPQNNKLVVNITPAPLPASVTTTSMILTVPAGTGSGHITLNTPNGIAKSTGDLYVPPGPFTASQVGYGGRTTFGTATAVSIAAANKIGLLLFDGQAGHNVSVALASPTFSSCTFQIYKPDNTTLGSTSSCSSAGFLDSQSLPMSGTYAVLINASNGSAGNATFTIYDSSDIFGTLTPGGPPFTVATTTPGQNARLTFFGSVNQHVSLTLSNSNFSACNLFVFSPDGTGLVPDTTCLSSTTFVEVPYLPERGVYTVKVDPGGTQTGTITLKLNDATDLTGTMTVGGPSVSPTTTVPGQNAVYTFSGTKNQHVSISMSNSTFNSCLLEIYNPDGTTLVGGTMASCTPGSTFYDVPLLPQGGTYTLVVDPQGPLTGSITVKLNDATDITGTITTDGTPVTITTTVPGQNARLTFSGSAGQVISGVFDNNTIPGGAALSVLDPTGAKVETGSANAKASAFLDPAIISQYGSWTYPSGTRTLPSNGTYTLLIDPSGAAVGSIRARLYSVPADQSASGTLGGTSIPISISTPGQNARITFSGTQNHKLSINLTGGTFAGTINSGCQLSLIEPNGALLVGDVDCSPASSFLDIGWLLPLTGTYTVTIDPTGNTTGSINAQLYDDTDINLNINADGTSNTVSTTVPGQNAYLNFTGTAGQRVFAVVDNISGYTGLNYSFAQLEEGTSHRGLASGTQDGSVFDLCGSGCEVYVLPANDTYSVFLNPNGTDVGSARVTVYTVPADFTSVMDTAGDPVAVSTTTPGQNAVLTFTASSSQSLTLNLSSGTYPSAHCHLSVQNPNNSFVTSGGDCSGVSHTFGPYSLTQTGTFTVTIDPQYGATGGVSVSATAH